MISEKKYSQKEQTKYQYIKYLHNGLKLICFILPSQFITIFKDIKFLYRIFVSGHYFVLSLNSPVLIIRRPTGKFGSAGSSCN